MMTCSPRLALVFALAIVVAPLSAMAQSYEQHYRWCFDGGVTRDQQIEGCSAVIAGGREAPDALAEAYLFRGISLRRIGQPDRALQDYAQAIRIKPNYSQAFNSRCYLHAISNRLQDALKECNEALRLDGNNQYAYDSRAFTYLKLGMLDASIADYNAALGLDPGRPYSLFGRGVARSRKGDKAGGRADMAAAQAKIPGIADEFASYGVKAE